MRTTPSSATAPPARPRARLDLTARLRSSSGFSIIEVLVSALMVILIASATARALISSSHFSGDQRLRSQADSVASQDQDRLRGLSDQQLGQLDSTSQTRTVGLNATTFTVTSSSSHIDTTGVSGCTSTAAAYCKISSTVTWNEAYSTRPATLKEESILSRPVSGDLPVVVTDQTGAGLSGASIVAKGSSTQSGLTDATGCVLFAGLIPSSYAIGITDAGYVDPNGSPASPLTVNTSVTSTGTAATNVHLGLGGSFTGTFVAATGLSNPTSVSGQADGISWTGTGGSYGMSAPQDNTATSPQLSLATDALFPFSGTNGYVGNYTIWGGRCPQQQPPAGTDAFSVNPGATLSQNVTEPALKLAFTFAGSSVQPLHVRLAFTSLSGTSCSYDWFPTIQTNTTTAASTGWLKYPGQPYADGSTGSLSLCVDYKSGTRTYTTTVPVTNTTFTAMNPVNIALTSSSTRASCPTT
jgi:type II secretory pathway pseudopilin PulG